MTQTDSPITLSFMFLPSRPALTLAFACSLLLAACETPDDMKKAKQDPIPLQKSETLVTAHGIAPEDKISKLEQQVAELQKEVTANRPKIAKIDVMEQKFKDLSLGLDRIDATYNMKPVVASVQAPAQIVMPKPVEVEKPVPVVEASPPKPPETPSIAAAKSAELKAEPKKAEAKPVSQIAGQKVVEDLRIGEKAEFSRLVLDLGQSVKVNYDIDNDEKILVIDIPGFAWKAAKTKTFPKSMLIASYQAESDDKGSRLVVQLKQPAKIANYSNIEAIGGKLPRAVLDVAAQ